MTTPDYLIGIAALALVLWNMRRHELTDRRLRLPLIISAITCIAFLPGVPTSGAPGALVLIGVLLGSACGALAGVHTRVQRNPKTGVITGEATPLAMIVTGTAFASRLVFAALATNGLGPAIGRFSASVGIHSSQAWVAALVLMAVADLLTRVAVLWSRRRQITTVGSAQWTPRTV